MSDKLKKDVKLSVRVPKNLIDFIDNGASGFSNRSEFINQALDFFVEHLKSLKSFERNSEKTKTTAASESKIHLKLKQLGWAMLEGMECTHIEYEFPIILEGQRVKLDVHGIMQTGEEVAVECWVKHKTDEEKVKLIKRHCKEVIILTVNDLLEYYEELLYLYGKSLNKLSTQLNIPKMAVPKKTVEFIGDPGKQPVFVGKTDKGNRFYRLTNEQRIANFTRHYRKIPYAEMVPILKEEERVFVEDFDREDKPKPLTYYTAAKKLSVLVGKKVLAVKGQIRSEDNSLMEGYLFAVEETKKV